MTGRKGKSKGLMSNYISNAFTLVMHLDRRWNLQVFVLLWSYSNQQLIGYSPGLATQLQSWSRKEGGCGGMIGLSNWMSLLPIGERLVMPRPCCRPKPVHQEQEEILNMKEKKIHVKKGIKHVGESHA